MYYNALCSNLYLITSSSINVFAVLCIVSFNELVNRILQDSDQLFKVFVLRCMCVGGLVGEKGREVNILAKR